MSLVAVRTPALQRKGGEGRIRTDIIRLRKEKRVKKEEKNEMVLGTFCAFVELCACVGVCVCALSPHWCALSTDASLAERPGKL